MRIGVGVGVFVVDAMVAHPLDDVFLRRKRLEEDEEILELAVCSITAMREVSMGASGDAKAGAEQDDELEEVCESMSWQIEERVHRGDV